MIIDHKGYQITGLTGGGMSATVRDGGGYVEILIHPEISFDPEMSFDVKSLGQLIDDLDERPGAVKKILIGLAAVIALSTMAGAGGCQDSQGTCHPGDTRASRGHTETCNEHGKWAPMTHQVKP